MFRRSPYHQVQPQQAQQQHNHYRFVVVVVFRVATILVMSALIFAIVHRESSRTEQRYIRSGGDDIASNSSPDIAQRILKRKIHLPCEHRFGNPCGLFDTCRKIHDNKEDC